MALTYDLTRVQNRDLSDKGWLVTQAVIWQTMAVGMNDFTEDNAAEFYARTHFIEARGHTMLLSDEQGNTGDLAGKYLLTVDDIRANVGVRTNATSYTTRAQWAKSLYEKRYLDTHVPLADLIAELDQHVEAYIAAAKNAEMT